MKFCSNISFMFTEVQFVDRYFLARNAGFHAIESGFPSLTDVTAEQIIEAKNESGLEHVLMNVFTGDLSKKQLGCATIPGREQEFAEKLDITIKFVKALNCPKIHLMSGLTDTTGMFTIEEQLSCYNRNMSYAAQRLTQENILGLIEPINKYSVPGYFMNNYEDAVNVIKSVGSPNLKLMLDIFHCQQIRGNVTRAIDELMPYVGHVQIAQVPGRGEPNSLGELDYNYILNYMEYKGYNDWIGLEYAPSCRTEKTLSWIEKYGFKLTI